jgi:hypothetical protein
MRICGDHEVYVRLYKPSTPERPLAVVVTGKEFSQVELEMWQGKARYQPGQLARRNTSSVNKDALKWLDVVQQQAL